MNTTELTNATNSTSMSGIPPIVISPHRYSFGILLWEMYTAGQPFKGIQKIVLSYHIAEVGFVDDAYSLSHHSKKESKKNIRPLGIRAGCKYDL